MSGKQCLHGHKKTTVSFGLQCFVIIHEVKNDIYDELIFFISMY